MHIEFTKPKGNAYCRMCYGRYGYSDKKNEMVDDKEKSLRNQLSLMIYTHDANGTSKSFYCMECAKKIKDQMNKVFEELDK